MPQTPAEQVLFSPADRFGLVGLLALIKMSAADPDASMLALGHDLSTLGLDLGAQDALYSSFVTPWAADAAAAAGLQGASATAAASAGVEPEYHLPQCYASVQAPPAQSKVAHFTDETLFFVFYSQPRDAMQELAAQELYRKNWRYHKELRLWLTKEAGTEPSVKTQTYERGSYIFFDPTIWERVRKDYVLFFDALEQRFNPVPH